MGMTDGPLAEFLDANPPQPDDEWWKGMRLDFWMSTPDDDGSLFSELFGPWVTP